MDNDHTFFRNAGCKYFPCHEVGDDASFNCLFCFCPLYWLADCGGSPSYASGVKDCTNCTLPHDPGGYERVLDRLRREFQARRGRTDA